MTRCPKCGSTNFGRISGRYPLARCLDCGTWWLLGADGHANGSGNGHGNSNGHGHSKASAEMTLPPGISALHVVLRALRDLQDEHGAVVEEVDLRTDGGSIILRMPVTTEDGDGRSPVEGAADRDEAPA